MPRRIRRARPSTQPLLPLRPSAPPVPVAPVAPAPPSPSQGVAALAEALSAAWNAGDWAQVHALMDVVKDHEELHYVRRWSSYDHVLCFAIGNWYWQRQAVYWQAQAECQEEAIDTVVDRLGELDTYNAGDAEQQQYAAWCKEHGHPDAPLWETDPAWFADPDIVGFVCDTLESTPYYHAKVQRTIAAMERDDDAEAGTTTDAA